MVQEKPAEAIPMHPRRSLFKYPRRDNVYKTKSSYNFDMMRAKIFANRRGTKEEMWLWFAHGCTGMLVGVIAFMMAFCEDTLTEWKAENVQHLIDTHNDNTSAAYGFYFSFCIALVLIANLMTLYVGPGANGSGVAEVMGLLNGINYP
jgi:H+/Cl- antiporter ClcA